MKDVIERMLKVEQEARTILANAEKESAKIAEAARREASERAEALRLVAHEETTKLLEVSRAELEQKRAERLRSFDRDTAAYTEQVRPGIAEAVETTVRRLLSQ